MGSSLIKTLCCKKWFVNDCSPIQSDGYCMECGHHPAIKRVEKLEKEIAELSKKTNLPTGSRFIEFQPKSSDL